METQDIKKCKCGGIAKRFLLMKQDGIEIKQYKCPECNEYFRTVNEEIESRGKYNGIQISTD